MQRKRTDGAFCRVGRKNARLVREPMRLLNKSIDESRCVLYAVSMGSLFGRFGAKLVYVGYIRSAGIVFEPVP